MADASMDRTAQALRNNLGSVSQERTYIDKLLAKEDVKEMSTELLAKKIFERKDVNKLQYLLNSSELKLGNLGETQRYVHNKYYCWIEEAMSIYCMYIDYMESDAYKKMSEEEKKIYEDLLGILTGVLKQFAFLYMHLARSSLSLGGWAIGKMLENKMEYIYDQKLVQSVGEPQRKRFFGLGG